MPDEPFDLDEIEARHARDDEGIDETDTLADIPALIAKVREQEQEIAELRSALEEQQQRAMGQLWAHDQVQHP